MPGRFEKESRPGVFQQLGLNSKLEKAPPEAGTVMVLSFLTRPATVSDELFVIRTTSKQTGFNRCFNIFGFNGVKGHVDFGQGRFFKTFELHLSSIRKCNKMVN